MKIKQLLALVFAVVMVLGAANLTLAAAPGAADKTVTTTQNTPYVFQKNDFGFTHPTASPLHAFFQVRITGFGVTEVKNGGSPLSWKGSLQLYDGTTWNTLVPTTTFTPRIAVSDIEAGRLRFVPASGEIGQPYTGFTFQNFDDNGTPSNTADDMNSNDYVIRINVNTAPANRAPDAVNDAITAVTGQDTSINILSNDTDADGNTLVVASLTQPTNGVTSIVSGTPQRVNYRSNAGFTGTDTFTYTINDGNSGTDTAMVTVTVQSGQQSSQVQIEKIKINGKTNGKLALEEESEIEVEVRNNLNEDLENVEITVTILDVDGDDLDEEEEIDINDHDSEKVTFTFDLTSENLDEENYEVEVKVKATDRNRVDYTDTEKITVDVDREKHDVVIRNASLDRSSVSCSTKMVNLQVRIENIGESDEDDIEIRVTNGDLDLDARRSNIDLDDFQGSDNDQEVTIPVNLADAPNGEHTFRVEVYLDGNVEDQEEVTLTVNCGTRTTATANDDDLVRQIQQGLQTRKTAGTTETSLRNSESYLVLLGVLAILAFVAVVLALAVVMRTKKKN